MKYTPIEPIDDHTKNRYEAVIVASRRARQINSHRLKLLELLMEDSELEIDGTKITTLALRDVMSGKVKFRAPGEEASGGEV
ncbi:MAG TPA: DNA-directed RNA polymerase subunit omega [candidate division Zixibacteria bacterium]|nr:DNA-directed RNA polymerase subunit omega [candidate division Zixibacteria bacterium]